MSLNDDDERGGQRQKIKSANNVHLIFQLKASIHREPVLTTYTVDAKFFLEVMKGPMHRFRLEYRDSGSFTFLRDNRPWQHFKCAVTL